jgi:hypothetical protein
MAFGFGNDHTERIAANGYDRRDIHPHNKSNSADWGAQYRVGYPMLCTEPNIAEQIETNRHEDY